MSDNREEISTKDVSIADVLARIWMRKYVILIWLIVGVILSIINIKGTPKEYTAGMRMVPETTESASKSGASAALAALGMENNIKSEDAYNPILYPDIVKSIPFVIDLFDVEVQTSKSDSTYTLRRYVETQIRDSWWNEISIFGKSSDEESEKSAREVIDPFHLTKSETKLYETISGRITLSVDTKSAEVSIFVTMQDALVAAQLVDSVAARLQEYITDYRTAKARHDLDYAIEINEEAKAQYYEAQNRYAEWMDNNQGLATYAAQSESDRLENDMELAFNLFNQTSQRVQAAEGKVQEVTPVFAVLSPSTVPLKPSYPKSGFVMVTYVLVFFLIGLVQTCFTLFFSKSFFKKVKGIIRENQGNSRNRRLSRKQEEDEEDEE